jgi:hypothetical protein
MKKKISLLYLCTIIYAVSLGTHYVWEMAQMPFYVDMRLGDPGAWLSCFEAAVSTLGEITSLRYERWAYSPLMPLIPVIEIGLVPVVQMILLPYMCYCLAITMYPQTLDSV